MPAPNGTPFAVPFTHDNPLQGDYCFRTVWREIFPRNAAAASQPKRALRLFIFAAVLLVCWVPGGVALAMLLTGNAGD